jgi:hypothetical protein
MAKQFKKPESGRPAASGFFAPTKNINNLPRHVLLKRLIYDPFTGVFRWKKPPCAKIKANDIAGHLNKNGYRRIRIDGVYYLAHRLAWLYVYGYMPENEIDHKDRNPKNNAISNLRESSHQCNMRNSKKQKNNQSGVTGVYFVKSRGKWAARIWIDDKCVFLGHHDDFVLAVRARWEAEKKYGFIGCNSTSTAFLYLKKQGLGVSL